MSYSEIEIEVGEWGRLFLVEYEKGEPEADGHEDAAGPHVTGVLEIDDEGRVAQPSPALTAEQRARVERLAREEVLDQWASAYEAFHERMEDRR